MMHADLGDSQGAPLPQGLRWAIEMLSGYDMRDVRVYYASNVPARVGARAIANGTDIHIQAGAEGALPHEAWHVVQQMQGRVAALNDVNGVPINDDPVLEKEADDMGAMAAALSVTGMWKRAKRAFAKARVKKPVVQRAVTVGNDRYTSSKEDFEKFVARVAELLLTRFGDKRYNYFPPQVMAEILSDFVMDDDQFANDAALLREIAIRNVGYQAEASMRALMDKNARVLGNKMVEREKALEAAKKQWSIDEQALYSDRVYKDYSAFEKAQVEIEVEAEQGYIVWQRASYLIQTTGSGMALWLADRTSDEPLKMNCWEGVLYSLVKSGLVGKGYISWANTTLKKHPFWHPDDEPNPTTAFLAEIVKIRDYYWSAVNGPLDTTDRRPQRNGWAHKEIVCIPQDFKIPKGRILNLNFGRHVALSTGRAFRIESETARDFFGTNMGHGILELDKLEKEPRTIKETTIEDLMSSMGATYLKNIMVAPFPIIAADGNPTNNEEVKVEKVPTVQEAIELFLEQNQTKIDEDLAKETGRLTNDVKRLRTQLTTLEQNPPYDQTKYNSLVEKIEKTQKQVTGAENKVRDKWVRLAMNSKGVKEAIGEYEPAKLKGYVKLPISWPYEAVDPYHGLVTFPDKK